jgi:putative ABC transport system permease protein
MNRSDQTSPKPIVAQDQVRLGFNRCVQLAVSGMSYRLFRSLVTTAILALAAAFLVHMLGYGLLENETQTKAYEQIRSRRHLGQQLSRFSQVDSERSVVQALEVRDETFCTEYERFSNATPTEMSDAKSTARRLTVAARYFEELATAPKAVIVGDRTAEELFDHLSRPEALATFEQHLRQFSLPAPVEDLSKFRALLVQERPALRTLIERIRTGHAQAVERLRVDLTQHRLPELAEAWLSTPVETLSAALSRAGFLVSKERTGELKEAALRAADRKVVERWLVQPSVVGAIARREGVELAKVNFDKTAEVMTSQKDTEWFIGELRQAGAKETLSAARFTALFEEYRQNRRLSDIAGDKPQSVESKFFGLSPRNQWLVILSFVVCAVGVANAMLMSVTERFTEIATMKCLGAMDRFVMLMFVVEASIQGAVGGLVGLILGLLLALVRAFVQFGSLMTLAIGASGSIGLAMIVSLFSTMVLAALSAVGPSYVAARLSPMEAMRVE